MKAQETLLIGKVHDYWNAGSCGANVAVSSKHSLAYFEEIENFRYTREAFIHSFAQFTRWHGKKILEVGIGAGTDFLQFVRAGAEAYGIDLTQEAVDNVSARLSAYGLQAKQVQKLNAEKIPYADNSFDLAYSWGVIHHSTDPEAVLKEIYRVTKPGGTVKVMVYNRNSIFAWYRFLRHALPRGKFKDGRRWACAHFQESFGTHIYSVDEIRAMMASLPHAYLTFSFFEQLPGKKLQVLRQFLHGITPDPWRWYLAFEFTKKSSLAI